MMDIGWHKILSLKVQGGFLDGEVIHFNPHLNCLIGGRGSGKTTVIEMLRFALDAYPPGTGISKRLQQHLAGVLNGGSISVFLETAGGERYNIERSGLTHVIRVTDAQGRIISRETVPKIPFGAAIYGQSELEQLADDPEAQLLIIDGKSSSIPLIKTRIENSLKRLDENRTKLADHILETYDISSQVAQLPEIKKRLQELAGKDLDGLIQRQRKRERERIYLSDLKRSLKLYVQQNKPCVPMPLPMQEEESAFEFLEQAQQVYQETSQATAKFLKQVTYLWQNALIQLEEIMKNMTIRHQEEELQDQKMRANLPGRGLNEVLAERTRLTSLVLELENLLGVLMEREQEINSLKIKREEMHDEIAQLKKDLYSERQKVCQTINKALGPGIQIDLIQGGNLHCFKNALLNLLHRSNLHYHRWVDLLVEHLTPMELVQIIKDQDYSSIEQYCSMDRERSRRLVNFLSINMSQEDLLKLEDVWLEDLPRLRLQDGEMYKSMNQLSKGQKCTTVLPLLLMNDARPLIIDQPEDHLDNSYISQTVVPTLKKVKLHRQVIFATHNPNIPVLGEAENNLILSSDGNRGYLSCQGDMAIKEVNRALQRVLEGGPDALRGRLVKYDR
ncbi:conserved hypothetical protein [Desulforamulus reducens MI-1]|uniref:Rad50/SbcC-type AAA domain-containing protein n=1 Tax=Desulforamulus reducens (strain ATCC BAA-1160 / DSM 100696 / MI-1) TaxID=349161 RepID=A4J5A9_DESRM|nr:AAA family ATPase [Desulforamulus reducens]ABO50262.1 conserved hypothetical protein [Desulforamulus reducens MI-1]